MADITFETKIDFGTFSGKKKLTFTSWNGNAPRYDIRDWYDDGKCGKGITLDKDELKSLYEMLKDIYEEDTKTEDIEWLSFGVTEEATKEPDEVVEEDEYPKEIQKMFDKLDEFFKGFETEKAYGKMPFADGDRLQYCVKKGKKDFPAYEDILKALDFKHFITNKGNLYIYTL